MKNLERRRFPPLPRDPKVLILRAHPNPKSFNSALAERYARGAEAAGVTVDSIDTDALDFDLRLRGPRFGSQPLEPALKHLQMRIAEAAHLVVASPVWWGSVPASFKGLIDRTFLAGWAYQSGESTLPEPGLRGRTSRVLLTMDAPGWWDRLRYGRSASRQLEDAWLAFVGMRSYGVRRFVSIEKTDTKARSRMLARAESLGHKDGSKVATRMRSFASTVTPSRVEVS